MEAGSKVMRAFHEALQKAIQLSESPRVRRRAAALGGSVAPHNVVAGVNDEGVPEVWVSLDSLGTGLGAQFNIEERASALHFYRRLLPNSGGHGFRRGGLAVDTAWCLYGMDDSRVTMLSNLTRIPTRSRGSSRTARCRRPPTWPASRTCRPRTRPTCPCRAATRSRRSVPAVAASATRFCASRGASPRTSPTRWSPATLPTAFTGSS